MNILRRLFRGPNENINVTTCKYVFDTFNRFFFWVMKNDLDSYFPEKVKYQGIMKDQPINVRTTYNKVRSKNYSSISMVEGFLEKSLWIIKLCFWFTAYNLTGIRVFWNCTKYSCFGVYPIGTQNLHKNWYKAVIYNCRNL